ncbi:MAG: hypothetical protein II966_03725, partial [Lachnospiraceae bacterium]|nr:hypothetical protein [Lachnospiraceae bacterium]
QQYFLDELNKFYKLDKLHKLKQQHCAGRKRIRQPGIRRYFRWDGLRRLNKLHKLFKLVGLIKFRRG